MTPDCLAVVISGPHPQTGYLNVSGNPVLPKLGVAMGMSESMLVLSAALQTTLSVAPSNSHFIMLSELVGQECGQGMERVACLSSTVAGAFPRKI